MGLLRHNILEVRRYCDHVQLHTRNNRFSGVPGFGRMRSQRPPNRPNTWYRVCADSLALCETQEAAENPIYRKEGAA